RWRRSSTRCIRARRCSRTSTRRVAAPATASVSTSAASSAAWRRSSRSTARARRTGCSGDRGATMIVCPSCKAVHEDHDTRFCGRCGSDLVRLSSARTGQTPALQKDTRDRMIGTTVDGRYRVIAKVGAGGMGAVYKVEHVTMGKLAAMKVLHSTFSQDKEVAQRFRREAEAVSKLSSPNTVQVFDFGESGGSMYLVMELVKGEDLGAILRRDGPMPFARLAPMMIQVCDALSEAHEAGIVHRDLKPENLLVSRAR